MSIQEKVDIKEIYIRSHFYTLNRGFVVNSTKQGFLFMGDKYIWFILSSVTSLGLKKSAKLSHPILTKIFAHQLFIGP